jgi:hypothetical protein
MALTASRKMASRLRQHARRGRGAASVLLLALLSLLPLSLLLTSAAATIR